MKVINRKITVNDILEKSPCAEWTEERLTKYIGRGKTLLEILDTRKIQGVSYADRIWCVIQFLPDIVNRKFAIWCARQCKIDTQYGAAFWIRDRISGEKQIEKLKVLIRSEK